MRGSIRSGFACCSLIPLILPIRHGHRVTAAMFRGGFPVRRAGQYELRRCTSRRPASGSKVLTLSGTSADAWDFFFPGPASRNRRFPGRRRPLQDDRKERPSASHMSWQPSKLPMSVRSEYAHAVLKAVDIGLRAPYRLSQVHVWEKAIAAGRSSSLAVNSSSWVQSGADAEDALGPSRRQHTRGRFRRELLSARWA